MKKYVFLFLCVSLLMAEESAKFAYLSDEFVSSQSHDVLQEELTAEQKPQDKFIYVAGEMNPLPTVALGFRMLYSSYGSDLSVSGSFLPLSICGKMNIFPIPGVMYKQLFFIGKNWEQITPGHSAFYVGAQAGVYPYTVNAGGLVGWQFRRSQKSDFFELGCSPFLYSREFRFIPYAFSLTYAFMF